MYYENIFSLVLNRYTINAKHYAVGEYIHGIFYFYLKKYIFKKL